MKKKQAKELKGKPMVELQKALKEAREKLQKLQFDLAAGKVKNIAEVQLLKKHIARILTIMNEQIPARNHNHK